MDVRPIITALETGYRKEAIAECPCDTCALLLLSALVEKIVASNVADACQVALLRLEREEWEAFKAIANARRAGRAQAQADLPHVPASVRQMATPQKTVTLCRWCAQTAAICKATASHQFEGVEVPE